MRLIDAEPVKKFIVDGLNNKAFGHDAIEILTEIEYAPTIEATPVVHGYWVDHCICSNCGKWSTDGLDADVWTSYEPPFCPNCGAKMNGGVEDG